MQCVASVIDGQTCTLREMQNRKKGTAFCGGEGRERGGGGGAPSAGNHDGGSSQRSSPSGMRERNKNATHHDW